MKAEERKQIETNTLADKMGRAMQKAKTTSRRAALIYAAVAAVVMVLMFLAYRYYDTAQVEASEGWLEFYDGHPAFLDKLKIKENAAGKAARLQIAWFTYWEYGIKLLGHNKDAGISSLKAVVKEYKDLQVLCADDPIFEPQAMLGQAVAEESLTIDDPSYLKKAENSYEALHKKYENSAEGRFAKKRVDEIKKDKALIAANYDLLKTKILVGGGGMPRFGDGGMGMDPHMDPEVRRMIEELQRNKGKK